MTWLNNLWVGTVRGVRWHHVYSNVWVRWHHVCLYVQCTAWVSHRSQLGKVWMLVMFIISVRWFLATNAGLTRNWLENGCIDQPSALVWAVFGLSNAGQTSIWLVTWGIWCLPCACLLTSGHLPWVNVSIVSGFDKLWLWSKDSSICTVSMFKCVCLTCFPLGLSHVVWWLANLGSSRSAVRWATCARLTSLALHNSASDYLRLASIHSILLLSIAQLKYIDDRIKYVKPCICMSSCMAYSTLWTCDSLRWSNVMELFWFWGILMI